MTVSSATAARPMVVLIFGTSHVGKTTLARRLGEELGWPIVSTDDLARHPGRPWPDVRQPVAEYYARLSDDTIHWFLRVHHDNMWPLLRARIGAACAADRGLVLEGSALRPEHLADLGCPQVQAIGLHAGPDFLRRRIEAESAYSARDAFRRSLIDRFIVRTQRDNALIVEQAGRLGLRLVNVEDQGSLDRLFDELTVGLARQ